LPTKTLFFELRTIIPTPILSGRTVLFILRF
jgi:hypothetical protein